jgi:prophage regulatory protein
MPCVGNEPFAAIEPDRPVRQSYARCSKSGGLTPRSRRLSRKTLSPPPTEIFNVHDAWRPFRPDESRDDDQARVLPPEATPRSRDPIRLLRLPQVMDVVGLSRSTIYALQEEGHFPKSVKLATRAVGWVETEIQAWLAERIRRRE